MDDSLETFVPLAFRRRGARRVVTDDRHFHDVTLLDGLARGFYWQHLIDIGAMRSGRTDLPALPYVAEFVDWVGQRIEKREPDLLANYRQLAPHAARAHPSEEHFLPLFIALGAAGEDYRPQRIYHATELQSLAMDAWAFH